ncbi:MAG: FkbM family methyltransferase [Bacteroidales bacterium]|jgi:FkbM family methyltransferase|nr:FkbM family methyltransferase [Bacteroidales bacterium]
MSIIRNISRNAVVRKIVPYWLQARLWDIVIKNKGEKLRKTLLKYDEISVRNTPPPPPLTKCKAMNYLKNTKNGFYKEDFLRIYLEKTQEFSCFNFCGALLPDVTNDREITNSLLQIFQDVFFFPCFLNDNYDKKNIDIFDPCMMEGPYGYTDGNFDVTVKKNDVVIDAGAWIGDFSAYAASKEAICYAFEPVKKNYELLKETVNLNKNKIIPVEKALGLKEEDVMIYISIYDTAGAGYVPKGKKAELIPQLINVTTLDKYVEENNITKVDFIKADIEGEERNLLYGSTKILQNYAPKLAICTYHSPADPQLLEKIILDANSHYKVIHTRQKLFAMIN